MVVLQEEVAIKASELELDHIHPPHDAPGNKMLRYFSSAGMEVILVVLESDMRPTSESKERHL